VETVPATDVVPVSSPSFVGSRLKRIRSIASKIRTGIRYEVHAFWRSRPIDPNVVLYESFAGNGMLCNPEAIFRALIVDPEFDHLTHVWVLADKSENRSVVAEFAGDERVRFVTPRSFAYYRALATSGYLINNATFPPDFGKRFGQVYLNTWHGTPLKRMGYDIGDPATRVGNVIRNFLNADYLLAANRFMTEQMYESAHLLNEIYTGTIIEEGYPRIDRQFVDAAGLIEIRQTLEDRGLDISGRQVVLYAPTWKGTNFNRPEDDAAELVARVRNLQELLGTSKYVVLLKTHQVVHKYAAGRPEFAEFLVPNEIPTNSVLAATDILVTDYSSIFFDFLATGRPIAFFTPDIGDYSDYRGLYMQPSTWPGTVSTTLADLAGDILSLGADGMSAAVASRYEAMKDTYVPNEDGHATQRVIDVVFRGRTTGYELRKAASHGRKRILFNAGSMRPNGITASLLNLLDSIDHDRFDVSVVFPTSRARAVLAKQREINPRVRQFARVGQMNGLRPLQLVRRAAWTRGELGAHDANAGNRKLWDDEWFRCFGNAEFDYAVDFSGYGPFFATLFLHAPGVERSIWMHNDLAADAHRTVGRRRPLHADLQGVFSLYRQYDHLVSVSPSLAEINRRALAQYGRVDQFESATNLISVDRTLAKVDADIRTVAADAETGEIPAWATDLATESSTIRFVTVGRLSPEKNHARLIEAFAIVRERHPAVQLFIVGAGPLLHELELLVTKLGLSASVVLTGHLSNAEAVIAKADCFVMSSDYEGQPMVLLEALAIGIPVVTVAFGSAVDSLPPGTGLLTASTPQGLADGMAAFIEGEVPSAPFDAAAYNRRALAEFYAAISSETRYPASAG
jgi:CDP-glycerol glycerophosphotransferase